ncbi:hypothetical protein [Pseudomonas sp.]|uniref:hypothetical protein n=1 Tax=Pseudomonas sp. TaxID=306 RepID=UPI002BC8789C|nr:hypothetical protein [Pseudomonas sp.]HUE94657.1 hypothetical protein [Pseudomonas sp.]
MNTISEQNPIYGSVRTAVDTPQLSVSAVSWGAIFAGAAAAAALSLILLILGTGLGLSSISPWANDGISATTFSVSTIIWVTLTQLLAAGMGGYLAGRLRTKWVEVHTDEVYFRDTAHGFLAWAVASLATATLLTSVIGSIVNGGVQAGAAVAGGIATTAMVATAGGVAAGSEMATDESNSGAIGYFLDTLFRRDMNAMATPLGSEPSALTPQQETAVSMAEVTRIFMNSVRTNAMPEEDISYVGQVVAQRTGLTQQQAEQRVSETFTRVQASLSEAETSAREAADSARKTSAYAAIWLFISLLIGAFVASFAAPYGGRQRDA